MVTIRIDKNVMVPMRDGVRLATDVYRLDDAPPAPVLLARIDRRSTASCMTRRIRHVSCSRSSSDEPVMLIQTAEHGAQMIAMRVGDGS